MGGHLSTRRNTHAKRTKLHSCQMVLVAQHSPTHSDADCNAQQTAGRATQGSANATVETCGGTDSNINQEAISAAVSETLQRLQCSSASDIAL